MTASFSKSPSSLSCADLTPLERRLFEFAKAVALDDGTPLSVREYWSLKKEKGVTMPDLGELIPRFAAEDHATILHKGDVRSLVEYYEGKPVFETDRPVEERMVFFERVLTSKELTPAGLKTFPMSQGPAWVAAVEAFRLTAQAKPAAVETESEEDDNTEEDEEEVELLALVGRKRKSASGRGGARKKPKTLSDYCATRLKAHTDCTRALAAVRGLCAQLQGTEVDIGPLSAALEEYNKLCTALVARGIEFPVDESAEGVPEALQQLTGSPLFSTEDMPHTTRFFTESVLPCVAARVSEAIRCHAETLTTIERLWPEEGGQVKIVAGKTKNLWGVFKLLEKPKTIKISLKAKA